MPPTAYREPYTMYPCLHTEIRQVGQLIGSVTITAIVLLWVVVICRKGGN